MSAAQSRESRWRKALGALLVALSLPLLFCGVWILVVLISGGSDTSPGSLLTYGLAFFIPGVACLLGGVSLIARRRRDG